MTWPSGDGNGNVGASALPRSVKRSTAAALFAILLLAVVVRLLPLLRTLYWGADFGEYYALARALVENGTVPSAYDGWGVTYPDFPGLYFVNGAFAFAGLSAEAAASVVAPALVGFVVLPVFLIAVRTTGDDLAALVAAAFLAVIMFHAYPTSHAIPAALGNLLLVAALLQFLSLQRSRAWFVPLALTGFAAVVTHHLATYVLLVASVAALGLRVLLRPRLRVRDLRYELAFVVLLAAATLAYWLLYARSLWILIITKSPFSDTALVLGIAAGIASVPLFLLARRRLHWRFRPRLRTVRGAAIAAGIAFAVAAGIMSATALAPVPGTAIRLGPEHLLFFLPTIGFVALAAAGRRVFDFSREGPDVAAWFVAMVASVVAGAALAPEALIPYRHLEYLAIPLALFAGMGVRWLTLPRGPRHALAAGAVALLVAVAAANAFPPPALLAGFDEGIPGRTVEAALWIQDHASPGAIGPLVAGDHTTSTVLFGFAGVDATWDRETRFWHTQDVATAVAAMASVRVDGRTMRVDWVVITEGMRRGLQTSPFAPALPLSPDEEAKFAAVPFHKTFDSGYAQVYFVNWGYAS